MSLSINQQLIWAQAATFDGAVKSFQRTLDSIQRPFKLISISNSSTILPQAHNLMMNYVVAVIEFLPDQNLAFPLSTSPRKIDYSALKVRDLTSTKSIRTKVYVRSTPAPTNPKLAPFGREFLLMLDSENSGDRHAIAVYLNQTKVGYVGPLQSHILEPALRDEGVDGFIVSGASYTDGKNMEYFIDIPAV